MAFSHTGEEQYVMITQSGLPVEYCPFQFVSVAVSVCLLSSELTRKLHVITEWPPKEQQVNEIDEVTKMFSPSD